MKGEVGLLLIIVVSLIMLGVLIFVHEFGHYLIARLTGIHVIEFAIGFGKKILGWEKGGTKYSLRVLPLGGYCKMLGEDPNDAEEAEKEGSFQQKPVSSRFAVVAAGAIMNIIFAVLLLALAFFFFVGVPRTDSTVLGEVLPEGKAMEAGLQEGDKILAINGETTEDWDEVVSQISARPGEEVDIRVNRNDQVREFTVTPEEEAGRGMIGIQPVTEKYALFASIYQGAANTFFFVQLIVVSLIHMIAGTIPADVAGPVGIGAVVGEVMQTNAANLLNLAAIISINLGIINLLPIPALDGSRLIFLIIEGIRGKPIDPQKEGFVHFIGFTLLILLIIFITFQDITRFIL